MRILLLIFFAILQVSLIKGATTVEQFNCLLTSEHVLGGADMTSVQKAVFASKKKSDNLALV